MVLITGIIMIIVGVFLSLQSGNIDSLFLSLGGVLISFLSLPSKENRISKKHSISSPLPKHEDLAGSDSGCFQQNSIKEIICENDEAIHAEAIDQNDNEALFEPGTAVGLSSEEEAHGLGTQKTINAKRNWEHKLKIPKRSIFVLTGKILSIFVAVGAAWIFTQVNNTFIIAGKRYDKTTSFLSITDTTITLEDIEKISRLASLSTLKLIDCSLDNEAVGKISELANIGHLDLSENPAITDCSTLSKLTKLKYLYLNRTGIKSISFLYDFTQLVALEMSGCNISDLSPISKCESLSHLGLSGNLIDDLTPMLKLIKLQYVDLSHNQLDSIFGMKNCAVLVDVNLSDNEIENIDILAKSAKTLKSADVSRNPLNGVTFDMAFADCPILEKLTADEIGISGRWTVSALPNIKDLSLAGNNIRSLDFPTGSGTQLNSINLSDNKDFDELNLADASMWSEINLSDTAINTLNLVLPSTSKEWTSLFLAGCASVDLRYLPTDVKYDVLDIHTEIVYNSDLISEFSGSKVSLNYCAYSDCFDVEALSDSQFYNIHIYGAPLDVQEKIRIDLSNKSVSFFDDESRFKKVQDAESINNNPHAEAIRFVIHHQLMDLDYADRFNVNNDFTREEYAKVIYLLCNGYMSNSGVDVLASNFKEVELPFDDIPDYGISRGYIAWAYKNGLMVGNKEERIWDLSGTYAGIEWSARLWRAMGFSYDMFDELRGRHGEVDWMVNLIDECGFSKGFRGATLFEFAETFNRGQMAQLIYNAICADDLPYDVPSFTNMISNENKED